jgi:hypothetical protein
VIVDGNQDGGEVIVDGNQDGGEVIVDGNQDGGEVIVEDSGAVEGTETVVEEVPAETTGGEEAVDGEEVIIE